MLDLVPGEAYVLGFDVGGTHIRAALADLRGDLLAEVESPSVRYSGQPEYGDLFRRLRDDLLARANAGLSCLRAVGVSVAGIVDPATEAIVMAPNLSSAAQFDLRALVGAALGLPVLVENDVNLAAVGEHRRGAARACSNFIFVAIGTGIGAGVFINGKLHRGSHNAAGEFGYMYVHGIEAFEQGGLGALEKRASGPGIARMAADHIRKHGASSPGRLLAHLPRGQLTSENVWTAAAQGDHVASGVIEEALDTLALGLANAALLLDPELILLGGGVSRVGDALINPLREQLDAMLPYPVAPRLELSQLGPRAQLYGAVYYALEYVDKHSTGMKGNTEDG